MADKNPRKGAIPQTRPAAKPRRSEQAVTKEKAKGRAKTVTESLDTSSRKVGPLSIFGISDFWRVPTILPKAYEDLTRPIVEYEGVQDGQWVCVGGVAVACEAMGEQAAEIEEGADDLMVPGGQPAGPDSSGHETTQEAEDAWRDGEDTERDAESDEDLSAEGAEVTAAAEGGGNEAGDAAEAPVYEEVDGDGSAPVKQKKHRVTLADMSGARRLSFHVLEKGAAERDLVAKAQRGAVLWVYGRAMLKEGEIVLVEARGIDGAALGEVHAYYPSKARKQYQAPARKKKGSKAKPAKGKWVVRKMSSNTVGVLVRDKNRFAIARCAQNLRTRLGLSEMLPGDEWLLMKTIGSPGPTLEATLKVAHRPSDIASGEASCRALERLAGVEMLQRIIEDRERRPVKTRPVKPSRKAFEEALQNIERNAGFKLTAEQRLCATEILVDMGSEKRTHRMLSGDVGTGKTAVFAAVAGTLCADGHLVVVLEPRSSLARQVNRNLKKYFPQYEHQLVTGESKERKSITSGMLVGTTGVWSRLQESGCEPILIVADEQQKFGVSQRQPIAYGDANLLESTATAIPRTQALMEFGGIEVSRLRHCHVRKEIETRVVSGKDALEGLYAGLKEAVEQRGRNLLLVYPMINGSADEESDDGVKAAEDEQNTPDAINKVRGFWEDLFPGKVDVIHGKMSEDEREVALRKFESGKSSVMIGTSILEVGLDLPKADMLVVHHPERLGVSAVHQLRGRLARQGGKGWCYLAVGNNINEGQLAVMKLMEVENDGFKLAQADMVRRGFGDMRKYAKQQSGLYEGFLVDRPPSIDDIEWVQDHCRRWIGGEEEGDLLDDTQAWIAAASKLMAEARPGKGRKDGAADQEPRLDEQWGLFDE